MQMPWSILPMRYATIVPQHAIYKLLTTDLDVNFLWMQTKCDASLDFSFLMQMFFYQDVDAKCPYDADVPCRGVNAKFIHDDASARIQTMMQISPYIDGDANVF